MDDKDPSFSEEEDMIPSIDAGNTAKLLDVTAHAKRRPDKLKSDKNPVFLGTGKLFKFFAKVTGLWKVHNTRDNKGYAVLCVVFVLLVALSLTSEILIVTFCGPLAERCGRGGNAAMNFTNDDNTTANAPFARFTRFIEGINMCNTTVSMLSLVLLIFSLRKLPKKLEFFSLESAQTRLSSKEWLVINLMLIVCVISLAGTLGYRGVMLSLANPSSMPFYITFGFALFITYTTSLMCCCVFAVVACALGDFVSTCFHDMKSTTDANLSDMVTFHQICRHRIFSVSGSLKVWFVVHWTMYGACAVVVFIFEALSYSKFEHFKSSEFDVVAFTLIFNALLIFIPSVYASRVTWQCNDLLLKINSASLEDWRGNHPFRDRATLNEFIFYAERSKTGFRLWTFTFGSTGTWISVLIGVIGLIFKLMSFINKDSLL